MGEKVDPWEVLKAIEDHLAAVRYDDPDMFRPGVSLHASKAASVAAIQWTLAKIDEATASVSDEDDDPFGESGTDPVWPTISVEAYNALQDRLVDMGKVHVSYSDMYACITKLELGDGHVSRYQHRGTTTYGVYWAGVLQREHSMLLTAFEDLVSLHKSPESAVKRSQLADGSEKTFKIDRPTDKDEMEALKAEIGSMHDSLHEEIRRHQDTKDAIATLVPQGFVFRAGEESLDGVRRHIETLGAVAADRLVRLDREVKRCNEYALKCDTLQFQLATVQSAPPASQEPQVALPVDVTDTFARDAGWSVRHTWPGCYIICRPDGTSQMQVSTECRAWDCANRLARQEAAETLIREGNEKAHGSG